MAGSKELKTSVVVSGSVVKHGFSEIQSQFVALSEYVQQLSAQLISFGEECADTYGEYEQNMADARAALATGTYKDNNKALNEAMTGLDEYAQKWAETTRFTTADVSEAISEAAHAGWDYTKMLEGIPEAMLLAQAGGLDLSTSMDYIVKSANATKTEFSDLGNLIDEWVVAANTGATNVDEIGQAMVKLGQVSTFADSTSELMTMLTILANSGSVGTEAGTLLRNTMIRLVAPTASASKAMESLGVTADEVEEALDGDDEKLAAMMQTLKDSGFDAYDKDGNLRSFLDIFTDLNTVLDDMTEEEKNDVLSTIFPQRSITGAKALLDAISSGEWKEAYDAINASAGAAQEASDIMMDTQEGELKILESRWEALKLAVGEEITGQIRSAAGVLGDIINDINNMDPAIFSGLVTGLETIAGLGVGLTIVGTAVKVISALGVGGGIGAAAIALGALAVGVAKYQEAMDKATYSGLFGDMTIDTDAIDTYTTTIGSDFETAMGKIQGFNEAMEQSASSYQTAAEGLSGSLLTTMLTGGTLTKDDEENLFSLGDDMYKALVDGITNGTAAQMDFWEYLFGGEGTAEENGDYRNIISTLNTGYDEALLEAEALGQGLRDKLTAAFADGTLTQEEYNDILNYMKEYNAAMAKAAAEAQSEQDLIDAQVLMAKSQAVGLDSVQEASDLITGKRTAGLDELETSYLTNYFRLKNAGASDEELAAATAAYEAKRAEYSGNYDDILMSLWGTGLDSSDMAGDYATLQDITSQFLAGTIGMDEVNAQLKGNDYLSRYMDSYIAAMGGYDEMVSRINTFDAAGDKESADKLRQVLAMRELISSVTNAGFGLTDNDMAPFLEEIGLSGNRYDQGSSVADEFIQEAIEVSSEGTTEQVLAAQESMQAVADANPIAFQAYVDTSGIIHSGTTAGTGGTGFFGRYAEGGRATTASIFGEAGAEWAIPEEHTLRTAELLDSARKASGFTWPELLARTGGMNAGTTGSGSTLVYSPTINANDTSGIAAVLENDKKRLENWFRNMQTRERMVSYA